MGAFFDLCSFAAFKPDKMDVRVPLALRFKGERILGVSLGNLGLKTAILDFASSGELSIVDPQWEPLGAPDFDQPLVQDRLRSSKLHYILGLTTGSVQVAVPRAKVERGTDLQTQELLATEPQTFLGKPRELVNLYSLVFAPKAPNTNYTMFIYPKKTIVDFCERMGIASASIARVQSGVSAILRYILETNQLKEGSDLLIVDQGVFCHVQFENYMVLNAYVRVSTGELISNVTTFLERTVRRDFSLTVVNTTTVDLKVPLQEKFRSLQFSFIEEPKAGEISTLEFKAAAWC
jgi:hypothetical protein